MQLNRSDVTIKKFKGRGPGGQNKNKVETGVRMVHKPTGIKVEVCNERDYTANLMAAYEALQAKLDNLAAERREIEKRQRHAAKPDVAFSAQIRSYVLHGAHQHVIDHRTGFKHPRAFDVLEGDIDGLLEALLRCTS